jgi:hypothetical protein
MRSSYQTMNPQSQMIELQRPGSLTMR